MSDEMDDDDDIDETPEEALEWLARELKTKGVRAAYKTAMAVCQDPKAPAPAKATMVTALMRAAGLFARAEDSSALEPHAMTAQQVDAELTRLRRSARRYDGVPAEDGAPADGVDVFK